MTRAEHLAWAKERALEYVEAGQLGQAVNSMISDLSKHHELMPGIARVAQKGARLLLDGGGSADIIAWIEAIQ